MQSIRWNQHSAHLTHSVSELYRDSDLTDCILDVEGKSIHVHKIIVAACSPYFKNLLKIENGITLIPVKDVTYKVMKLILDFIYFGEADVHITDVTSFLKTAELLEMTSLKHSVSHCFQIEFSTKDASERSAGDSCSVPCTNVIRHGTKNSLEEQVSRDRAVLYTREERLRFKSENIHVLSIGDHTTKYLKDFQDVSGELNIHQSKSSASSTCDSFKKNTKHDKENVNEELVPLAFVAVSEIKEPNEEHQDTMCFDSVLKDPLGEYPGTILDVSEERSVKKECTFQSELQVKKELKDENDVPESMTDVLVSEKLMHSFHELSSTKCTSFESCGEESDMVRNPDVILSDTFCSEGCDSETTHDLNIKFESICEISGADVKEKKVFETGQCLNHLVGENTGTVLLKPESELLNSGVQCFLTTDNPKEVNEEDCDASTREDSNHFALEKENKTAAIHTSEYTDIERREERKNLMQESGGKSSHIRRRSTRKQNNNQHFVPKESLLLDPLEIRGRHGLRGKIPLHSIQRRNYLRRKSFSQGCTLKNHLRSQIGDKAYLCEICKSSFREESQLNKHMRVHSRDKQFQCDICKKSFRDKSYLPRHMLIHSGHKPYQCEICKSSFIQGGHLKSHMRIHTGDKPFQCGICKSSFREGGTLKRHMSIHLRDIRFQCEICKSTFNARRTLSTHMSIHLGDIRFQCDICKSVFSEKGSLKRHMVIHSGDKPFQCDICKKSFSDKSNLQRHMRVHSGDKPFQCKICKSLFSQSHNLKGHMRLHSGEKAFQCEICKSAFRERCNLKRHMRIHSDV